MVKSKLLAINALASAFNFMGLPVLVPFFVDPVSFSFLITRVTVAKLSRVTVAKLTFKSSPFNNLNISTG